MEAKDKVKLERLRDTFDNNYKITRLYAAYLEHMPELITEDMMRELTDGGELSKLDALTALVCEILGLDFERREDRVLIRDYVTPSVRLLTPERYTEDAYYKNVKIENKKIGNWEFRRESYPPYRAVICDDLITAPDFREIPPLGFFSEKFDFPAVLEDGNEWMTLTPVDMDTCREAIDAAHGKVVTFGLGLGYYAYHAARREEVESVTVVERSEDVIKLFREELLPQMECRDKIKIIRADAFEYAKEVMPKAGFDIAFVDIWRDGGDGAEAYRKMKPLEELSPNTKFLYWIEGFILSRLRAVCFETMLEAPDLSERTYAEITEALWDKKRLAEFNGLG